MLTASDPVKGVTIIHEQNSTILCITLIILTKKPQPGTEIRRYGDVK